MWHICLSNSIVYIYITVPWLWQSLPGQLEGTKGRWITIIFTTYILFFSQLTQVIRWPCYLHFQHYNVIHFHIRKASRLRGERVKIVETKICSHELTLRLQLMRSDQGSVEMHWFWNIKEKVDFAGEVVQGGGGDSYIFKANLLASVNFDLWLQQWWQVSLNSNKDSNISY